MNIVPTSGPPLIVPTQPTRFFLITNIPTFNHQWRTKTVRFGFLCYWSVFSSAFWVLIKKFVKGTHSDFRPLVEVEIFKCVFIFWRFQNLLWRRERASYDFFRLKINIWMTSRCKPLSLLNSILSHVFLLPIILAQLEIFISEALRVWTTIVLGRNEQTEPEKTIRIVTRRRYSCSRPNTISPRWW